jgi:hypothetical protein
MQGPTKRTLNARSPPSVVSQNCVCIGAPKRQSYKPHSTTLARPSMRQRTRSVFAACGSTRKVTVILRQYTNADFQPALEFGRLPRCSILKGCPRVAHRNPKGIESLSPGLRATRYPGWAMGLAINPERVASFVPFTAPNPTHTVHRMPVRTAPTKAGTHCELPWPMNAAWRRERTGQGSDASLKGLGAYLDAHTQGSARPRPCIPARAPDTPDTPPVTLPAVSGGPR